MNGSFLKNYTAFIVGGILSIGMAILFVGAGWVIIEPAYDSIAASMVLNLLSFVFCWLVLSFLLHKFPIYKVLGVFGLLITALLIENLIKIPSNPVTVPLLILFWLGIAYLILPQFFNKYKVAILAVYGACLSYFFIFRTAPNYLENYNRNFLNFLVVPIPVFISLWFYEQWRWLKTLQADKGKTELALLKSQINPHFFFNTLNNLYGLVVEKSEKAPEVILKLSDMMRYAIYEGKEDFVLLKDEINYLENYLELHKIRYRRKVDISFTYEVEEGLKIAPLLFIILLENAFKHGVDKMNEQAFIHLRMESRGKRVFFLIENSFDPSTSNRSNGIGLENLKKRLAHAYPDRHELKIEENGSTFKVQLNLELL